jgi:regulator of protease activity HflC (stomatin/prohibitin superfamily)
MAATVRVTEESMATRTPPGEAGTGTVADEALTRDATPDGEAVTASGTEAESARSAASAVPDAFDASDPHGVSGSFERPSRAAREADDVTGQAESAGFPEAMLSGATSGTTGSLAEPASGEDKGASRGVSGGAGGDGYGLLGLPETPWPPLSGGSAGTTGGAKDEPGAAAATGTRAEALTEAVTVAVTESGPGPRIGTESATEPQSSTGLEPRTEPEPAPEEWSDAPEAPDDPRGEPSGRRAGTPGAVRLPGAAVPGDLPGPKSGSSFAVDEATTAAAADGDWAFADRPGGEDALVGALAGAESARRSPLIVGEATHEIPVHLLFRDEVDPAVRRSPTVVGRRLGTGELPRIRRTAAPSRPEPAVDPRFNERPGPALPGWAAAFAGALTLTGCLALLWRAGAMPDVLTRMAGLTPYPYHGIGIGRWLLLTLGVIVLLFTLGGLSRGRVGHALVLTLFGEYRGTVRRTGLLWISPLLLRRRVDVRLRHWRSEPMPAMDANGTALRVVVLVVWRVRDTVRATLGIRDHEEYLREQVEAALARVLSQLPADAFQGVSPTLRNVEAVGDSLTRLLSTECRPAGIEVFSAQPTRIEYAPEIADVMRRSRIAALDARHRDTVLNAVVDAVDDTVQRLTARGLVELDDYDRKALVKDLTVAFYTGRAGGTGEPV